MTRRIAESHVAQADLEELSDYIARDNLNAARRLRAAVAQAYRRLIEMPALGVARAFIHPELAGIRSLGVPGFRNHLIFYRVTDDEIVVERILHGARDIPRVLQDELGE